MGVAHKDATISLRVIPRSVIKGGKILVSVSRALYLDENARIDRDDVSELNFMVS